jgi:hypothetical protein
MDETRAETTSSEPTPAKKPKPRRWKRFARRFILAIFILAAAVAFLLRDHIRTLQSLRHVPGTNAYVMDYYLDYNIDEIRSHGMDVVNVEDGLIGVFFPDWIAAIAQSVKHRFIADELQTTLIEYDRCSTITWSAPNGRVYFGRNFDWLHDACLILRVHKNGAPSTVSVIDLHYLNLDRDDLESTSLIRRIPLLFAPFYLQDGMNQHGVAVADMSVDGVTVPRDTAKPEVLHSTAMRLILDYAKTTDEAIELLKQYNVYFIATTCHLMIADAGGKSAVVEFIDGKMEVTPAGENWQVCTNHQICGTSEEQSDQTCERYRIASEQLALMSGSADAGDMMRVMESVSKKDWTMWSSVYDLTNRTFRLAYRGHFDQPVAGSLAGDE